MPPFTRRLLSFVLVPALLVPAGASLQADNWPAWRGATGQGISTEKDLPVEWGPEKNVRWKTPLPDAGNSTPIVWGERLFITQATEKGKKRATMCFETGGGKLIWTETVPHGEPEPTHEGNPYCSASAVTDGERLIVSHGSAGVFAYSLDGRELWRRDLGKFHHIWGNAASPVIGGDLCFLNCGPGARTFLIALEKRTGKTVWQVDIAGGNEGGDSSTWTGSWSTPLLWRDGGPDGGREELLASFPDRLRAYAPATGKELWSCAGLGRLVYTSPLAAEGVVVAMSGFMGPPLAVRAGGEGDVTEARRLWRHEKAQQRIGSGVIADGHIYIANDPGVAECIELRSGKSVWRERLGATTWSSTVLADGKLYVGDDAGDFHVLRASTTFERLARNSLGELTRASVAISGGRLYLRTYKHLWCIARAP